jgi:hypothetical protein
MKICQRILFAFLPLLCVFPAHSAFGFTSETHWNSTTEGGWACVDRTSGGFALESGTNSPDPNSALKFIFPAGWNDAHEPAMCWYMFPGQASEFWIEYYFKYSSNYSWHGVDNKQTYYVVGPQHSTNFYISVTGDQHLSLVTQTFATDRHFPNTGYNPTIEKNRWYRLKLHAVINSPGQLNGIAQVWLDDRLVIDTNKVGYRSSSQSGVGFTEADIVPVYGGSSGLQKPAADYQWYDHTIVSTVPIGSSPLPAPISPTPPMNLQIQ